MKEAMLGTAVAALALGWVYGRLTERTRRSFKDVVSSRTTYDKAMKVRSDQIKRSIIGGVIAIALVFMVVSACSRWDTTS